MKRPRKPRTPRLDLEKLREVRSERTLPQQLRKLESYFLLLEKMKDERSLNTPFIALEALSQMTSARIEGFGNEDLLELCPEAWGDETITVPLPLLIALTDVWDAYRTADAGVSLGESFGIEGHGQGNRKMKARLEQRLKEHRIANAVETAYLSLGNTAEATDAISLDVACKQVAEDKGLSEETVRIYHRKHSQNLRNELKRKNIL